MKERYHTLEIRNLGGLLQDAPHMGWILGFCAMASLGLPGLAGFWGTRTLLTNPDVRIGRTARKEVLRGGKSVEVIEE